jgi:hypothetical protein
MLRICSPSFTVAGILPDLAEVYPNQGGSCPRDKDSGNSPHGATGAVALAAYLAVVLNAFSRRVIGWALDRSLDDNLTIAAITMAFCR